MKHVVFGELEELSSEDKQFMMMMENRAEFVNGLYYLRFPVRNLIIPSKRITIEKKANYFKKKKKKKRFMKNKKYFEVYKKLMNDILQKGYTREASEVKPYDKTLYIPHHNIYHPDKLGKNRVVFDCSADLNERSINQELISGPDLTIQLVGVLIRFRHEQMTVKEDIESMFYQIWLSEEHRRF